DKGYDYVLFSAGASVSKQYAPIAAERGAVVIDNSSAFRSDAEIPLVVPEINGDLLKGYCGIVANPNCSTIQMVLSLSGIHKSYGIKTIVVSTYQAVSGAGNKGIAELEEQERGDIRPSVFVRQIHRNVVPVIGDLLHSNFSTEEMKMVHETRKIFRDDSISVWPTTVRVPVAYGHSESVFCETVRPFSLEDLIREIESSEDVVYSEERLTPIEVAGSDLVFVSRLRGFDDNRFLFWNIADNIRVGAATNAIRIMKTHLGGT
ncbi:MAG: aspartate-semialdehyde dehydrogenase, partial [Mesotoga sp.]